MSDKLLFAVFACAALSSGSIGWPTQSDDTAYLVASGEADPTAPSPTSSRTIHRDTDGLFRIAVLVEGERVDMIVDTGASRSIISRSALRRLRATPSAAMTTGTVRTLSGESTFDEVRLTRLQIGAIVIRDLPVAVMETPDDLSLLGGDVLRRIGRVTLDGDRITID